MRTTVRAALAALAIIVIAAGLAGSSVPRAEAGPLAGSTWCQHRDSMAIFGGSSNTGYLTTGYTRTDGTYQPTQYGWWKQLSDFAAANWGTQTYNYARNGASYSSYLPGGQWDITRNAVSQIGETQPDLLFLALGTNEYLAQVSPDTMEANMRQVVDAVKLASPRTSILAAVQQTAYAGPAPTYSWELYKRRIQAVAVDEYLAMADFRQSVPSAYSADWQRWYHPDRIHMLDVGHQAVSAGAKPWLFFCN